MKGEGTDIKTDMKSVTDVHRLEVSRVLCGYSGQPKRFISGAFSIAGFIAVIASAIFPAFPYFSCCHTIP